MLALAFALAQALLAPLPSRAKEVPRRLRFSGREWLVVDVKDRIGPGPNYFDGRNASVDPKGRLVLRTAKRAGKWTAAQVFLTESLGYGTYELAATLEGGKLDAKAVFGFYTWDEDPAYANREIDIELSRWGQPEGPNVHFTVQPWDGHPERGASFSLDLSGPVLLRLEWLPGSARFSVSAGGSGASWEFLSPEAGASAPPGFGVPPAGRERIGLNLWLMKGEAPGAADRATIESFAFSPAR